MICIACLSPGLGGHFATSGVGRGRARQPLAQLYAAPDAQGVVLATVVVGVEKLLEPLEVLKVVLEPAQDQPVHRDDLQFASPQVKPVQTSKGYQETKTKL